MLKLNRAAFAALALSLLAASAAASEFVIRQGTLISKATNFTVNAAGDLTVTGAVTATGAIGGGALTATDITCTDASLAIAGQAAAQGGAVAVAGGASSTATNAGGAITSTGGAGGSTSGAGGAVTDTGGAGGGSGAGGAVSDVGGAGGATGAGGAASVTGGAGGATSGTGGAASVTGGAGTAGNSAGGAASVTAGAGQGTGAGGATTIAGGASGAGATGNGGAANVTAGAALSTNGNGGSVVITPGVGTGTGFGGQIILASALRQVKQAAPTAKTTSATLTAAEVLVGIITVNQGAGATSSLTLPTGTAFEAGFASFATDDAYDFTLINISTVAAEDADILTNTGWTLVGSMAVQSNDAITSKSTGTFRARRTAANTFTLYRVY